MPDAATSRPAQGQWSASVLIPLLRQDDGYLTQAVRSACTQTVRCEVVVATSPRTPASNLAVLERLQASYRQLVVVAEGPAPGMASALNAALQRASADRVGFLMSDDWLMPEAVASCLPIECDIVSTGLTAYLADGRTELAGAAVDLSQEGFAAETSLHRKAAYLSHFYLLRKSKVLAAGGLDESLGAAAGCGVDDFDLVWTLLERGASVGIVPQRLYCYRDHPGQRLTLASREDSIAALRRILDKHGLAGRERLEALIAHGFWQGKSLAEGLRQLRAKGAAP
jgi:glycosyltransferase involved in cell wall biosynthesis